MDELDKAKEAAELARQTTEEKYVDWYQLAIAHALIDIAESLRAMRPVELVGKIGETGVVLPELKGEKDG